MLTPCIAEYGVYAALAAKGSATGRLRKRGHAGLEDGAGGRGRAAAVDSSPVGLVLEPHHFRGAAQLWRKVPPNLPVAGALCLSGHLG